MLEENETAEEAFNRLLPAHDDCSVYHSRLQKMLKVQSNLKTISDARQADGTSDKDNKEDDEDEDDPQLFGQAKSAMQDVLDINTKKSDLTLHERL